MHFFLEGVYTALVQQCGMCPQLKECLFWMPNCLEPTHTLLTALGKHTSVSGDEVQASTEALQSSLCTVGCKTVQVLDEAHTTEKDSITEAEMLERLQGNGDENGDIAKPVKELHPYVLILLGVCSSRMMPDHPCGLASFLPSDKIHAHLSRRGPWTSAHLALHLLTSVDLCLSKSRLFGDDVAQEITQLCIQTLSSLELGVDQVWIMSVLTSYKGYPSIVSGLSSNGTMGNVCQKGILPLLNKVMEVGVIEGGAILDSEDEEKRILEKVAWFLPYVLLFPVTALEQILRVAVTNTGLLNLLCKMVYRLKPLVAFEISGDSSRLVMALQLLVQDSKGLLDTDLGSAAFADLIGKLFDDSILSTMDVMKGILMPCLRKYMSQDDVPLKAILCAIKLLSNAKRGNWSVSGKATEGIDTVVDLVILLCKILAKRPCALSWGCSTPRFVPLGIIELCDEALDGLLSRLSTSCESDSDKHWHNLEALLQTVDWPARVKVVAWLDIHKRLESQVESNKITLLSQSLKKESLDGNDAYWWAQLMEDVCLFFSACTSQSQKIMSRHSSSTKCMLSSSNGVDDNDYHLTVVLLEKIHKCPPHLLSWCAVMSIARILPFMTSRESISLCLGGLPALLSHVDSPEDPKDWDWPELLQMNLSDITPVCTIVELICRAIYCLSAHEDVIVVDRAEAVTAILMRLNEIGEGVLEGFSKMPRAIELVGGRCFSEICGLVAAIQEYYPCDVIQVSKTVNTTLTIKLKLTSKFGLSPCKDSIILSRHRAVHKTLVSSPFNIIK